MSVSSSHPPRTMYELRNRNPQIDQIRDISVWFDQGSEFMTPEGAVLVRRCGRGYYFLWGLFASMVDLDAKRQKPRSHFRRAFIFGCLYVRRASLLILRLCFNIIGKEEDRPRSRRPRVTTRRQDPAILLSHFRDRFRPFTGRRRHRRIPQTPNKWANSSTMTSKCETPFDALLEHENKIDALIHLSALCGSIFTNESEAAFSNYRMWESLCFIIAFAYISLICTRT
ncbi:hypothetical protein CAPTEDRAFT_205071 [Capitella teleta]|uniref:Uncharacterized protein n=1 Tax=Capitella teleta TaxID=283909 RepID=R7T9A9_CAPTE|nr:hypothetical protein CAPTEDRAFT_205071 [Capitella teleta]|eukprot:ELT90289.1 hypothetical protein CAPTEDRAFT_205071 [Capitella teleta]